MPTYNYGQYLDRAINSVLNQTFRDYELIIVDDGSTDNTKDVVSELRDNRIKYIKHDTNMGGNTARNTGIRAATGKYIAFLDGDDEWFSDKLSKQINKFKECASDVGLIYTGARIIDTTGKSPSYQDALPVERGNIFEKMLIGNYVTGGGSSLLIKRECFDTVGFFDVNLPSGQEWELIIRISKKYKIDFVPEVLINYYIHGANTDSYPKKIIKGFELILSKHRDDYLSNTALYALQYYKLGHRCFKHGFMSRGRTHLLNTVKFAPFNFYPLILKSFLHILASFMGHSIYAIINNYYLDIENTIHKHFKSRATPLFK